MNSAKVTQIKEREKITEKWQAVTTTVLPSAVVAVTNRNEQNFFTPCFAHSTRRNRQSFSSSPLDASTTVLPTKSPNYVLHAFYSQSALKSVVNQQRPSYIKPTWVTIREWGEENVTFRGGDKLTEGGNRQGLGEGIIRQFV